MHEIWIQLIMLLLLLTQGDWLGAASFHPIIVRLSTQVSILKYGPGILHKTVYFLQCRILEAGIMIDYMIISVLHSRPTLIGL